MKPNLLSAALVGAACLCAALPAVAQDSGEDPVVARVDGAEIRRSEVLESARELPPQYQAQLQQIFPALVQRLVDFRLLAKAAKADGLAEDEEVERRVEEARMNVMRDGYLERQIDKAITDEALETQYKVYLEANPPVDEVRARHILLEDEAAARAVIVELDGGADFAALAQERSTGPSSAQGGDLGFFTKDQMVPEFANAAFAMEDGKHSAAPVQTQFGWHVIKVEERRSGQAAAFEEIEEQLRDELSRTAVDGILAGLRERAEVEILPAPALE